jgi:hypothetical protein
VLVVCGGADRCVSFQVRASVAVEVRQKLLFQCRVPTDDSTGGEKRKWHRDRSAHKHGGKGRKKEKKGRKKKSKHTTPTCLRWRH